MLYCMGFVVFRFIYMSTKILWATFCAERLKLSIVLTMNTIDITLLTLVYGKLMFSGLH